MEAVLIWLKMRYATVKYSWSGSKMKDFASSCRDVVIWSDVISEHEKRRSFFP